MDILVHSMAFMFRFVHSMAFMFRFVLHTAEAQSCDVLNLKHAK